MLPTNFPVQSGAELPNQFGGGYGRACAQSATSHQRWPSVIGRAGGSRRDGSSTGWHRKHAVRALRQRKTVRPGKVEAPQEHKRRYGATVKDAMMALWEASDRVCGKRLKVRIPTLLPALEQHGRLQLGQSDRNRVLAISAATIDSLLVDVKIAASGGRRRRAGFDRAADLAHRFADASRKARLAFSIRCQRSATCTACGRALAAASSHPPPRSWAKHLANRPGLSHRNWAAEQGPADSYRPKLEERQS
jgi:hypothetical protein